MEMVLERVFSAELMQTYLPSLGLLLCTFITTKFKQEFFGENVGVNLTLMLLIFTMFTSKFAELPPTQYIKMIDIWLIFCMLIPFTEVVLITMIEHYTEHDEDKDSNNTLDNRGEGEPMEDIQTDVSRENIKMAPGPAWLSRSTSVVSPSKGGNFATKGKLGKDKIIKTKERKLQICKKIGRSSHEQEFKFPTFYPENSIQLFPNTSLYGKVTFSIYSMYTPTPILLQSLFDE